MVSELDILAEILETIPSRESYPPMERYRDFRKVFGTDEGKRALNEIISWGRILHPPIFGRPIDPYAMAIAFGERNLAQKLMAAVYVEPTDKPQRATQRKKP